MPSKDRDRELPEMPEMPGPPHLWVAYGLADPGTISQAEVPLAEDIPTMKLTMPFTTTGVACVWCGEAVEDAEPGCPGAAEDQVAHRWVTLATRGMGEREVFDWAVSGGEIQPDRPLELITSICAYCGEGLDGASETCDKRLLWQMSDPIDD